MVDQAKPEALARKHLDAALSPFRAMSPQARPPRSWLRAIRDALGMTSRQLAARMGLSQPTIIALEKSEAAQTITLRSLRAAAEALDRQLVYALVPRSTLDETVHNRARAIAQSQHARINHTMRLEDQALTEPNLAAEVERVTQVILAGRPSRLWEAP